MSHPTNNNTINYHPPSPSPFASVRGGQGYGTRVHGTPVRGAPAGSFAFHAPFGGYLLAAVSHSDQSPLSYFSSCHF